MDTLPRIGKVQPSGGIVGMLPRVHEMAVEAPDWNHPTYMNWEGRSVGYKDVVNMTNMEIAQNGTAISAARILGPLATFLPIPGASLIGFAATAYGYSADGRKLAENLRKNRSNTSFWMDYNKNVMDVATQSGYDKVMGGIALGSNVVSGQVLPSEIPESALRSGGMVVGQLAQAATLFSFGTNAFIYGNAAINAVNSFHNEIGIGSSVNKAVGVGVARGLASGISAKIFMSWYPRLIEWGGGKMIDAGVGVGFVKGPVANFMAKGLEFSGWGTSEMYAESVLRRGMGQEDADFEFSIPMTLGMFALGGVMSGALKGKGWTSLVDYTAKTKSAIKAVDETIGSRVAEKTFGVTDAELVHKRDVFHGEGGAQEALARMEAGTSRVDADYKEITASLKSARRVVLERNGVPKRLATDASVDKLGGVEQTLKVAFGKNKEKTARVMEELDTVNRLVVEESKRNSYSLDYYRRYFEKGPIREGVSFVEDRFVVDNEAIARKVRVAHNAAVGSAKINADTVPKWLRDAIPVAATGIFGGMLYSRLSENDWSMTETMWLTPQMSAQVADLAVNAYRQNGDRARSMEEAMNAVPDVYALNPENYRSVYDRFMRVTGGIQ